MSEETQPLPPGWHLDEETCCLVRDTIHRMGRRCRNWNYCGTGCYLVTMVLRDRSQPVLGEVRRAIDGAVRFFPTELGRRIEAHLRRLPEFSPEIEVLGAQPMPDHLHAVLRVRRQMPKPLGECLRGFKIGCTKIWRECLSPTDGRALSFAAVGNRHLLSAPALLQVQCSRRDFAYARAPDGTLRKDAPPAVRTPLFEEKCAALLAAAAHGAVLVSPCISHGEKEIARRALAAGARLVALQNKGFPALFKPPGLLFDRCTEGRLLLLAPAGWPYLPGEKRMTREDSCVLNRIAQLLCGSGAAEIRYRGLVPAALDRMVEKAMRP